MNDDFAHWTSRLRSLFRSQTAPCLQALAQNPPVAAKTRGRVASALRGLFNIEENGLSVPKLRSPWEAANAAVAMSSLRIVCQSQDYHVAPRTFADSQAVTGRRLILD